MTTSIVYADTTDGFVWGSSNVTYETARSTGTNVNTAAALYTVGQTWTGSYWNCYEGFSQFNTSPVGSDTVSSAVLNVTSSTDSSVTDFTMEARIYDWGADLTVADFVAGASLGGCTLVAHYATASGFTVGTPYDFVNDAFPANINGSGQTLILINSDRHRLGTTPTGNEYVQITSADYAGTSSDPKLTITHAAGTSLFLMLEDGSGAYEKEDSSGGIVLEPEA